LAKLNQRMLAAWDAHRGDADGHDVSLSQAFLFVTRHHKAKHANAQSRSVMFSLWGNIVRFLSGLVDAYVFDVYGAVQSLDVNPRVLRAGTRPKGGLDAETAWGVLERANKVYRATPELVVAIKNDEDKLLGVHATNGLRF